MDYIQLFQDHGILYQTEGHKHCRPGWVNMPCPFCTGNPGYHLGVRIEGGWFRCWRCGPHPPSTVLSTLLGMKEQEAKNLLKEYLGVHSGIKGPKVTINKKSYRHPSNVISLNETHKKYLRKRNFDPELLESLWQLKGTGPVSKLDHIDYSFRILAPIFWEGKEVSFQTRDIFDKSQYKYLACPQDREIVNHKHILYCHEKIGRIGIGVEGITDVWRLGVDSFATFGIEYLNQQIRWMKKMFDRVFICFDDDPQAVIKAKELVAELNFRGLPAFFIPIKGDPGSMEQREANYLVKQLTKQIR